MKKIFLLLVSILSINHVKAMTETDITTDANIKYKWYKEKIIDELYYPKKNNLIDYIEDITKVEYGPFSDWSDEYCDYSEDYYFIERKTIISYDKLDRIKYVLINNASATCPTGRCTNEVKIYYNFENLNYKVLRDNYFGLFIELPDYYEPEKLLFYIDTEHKQVIYLSKDNDIPPIMIASPASDEMIQVVNNEWKANENAYVHVEGDKLSLNIPLIKNIDERIVCRFKEINTYRYKIEKEYYDDNYHIEVANYIPDIADYQINYLKPFPETKEIVKNILVPKLEKEYIYLQNDGDNEKNECNDSEIVYQTKYVNKLKKTIPIKIYILICFLNLVIIFLSIKLLSNKVV